MKKIYTKNAPEAVGPYSQGIVEGDRFYSSGQIPINPKTGTIEAETIEEQAEQVCQNLEAVLSEAGASFASVIKTTCYLTDMADFAAFNAVYAKYFTEKPARSCVGVKALPMGAKCEIELIAETAQG